MNLIEEWNEDSAYTFDSSVTDEMINEYGSDHDLICAKLDEKYPEDKYFVLVDYIDDNNMGYFHIRVWELDKKYEKAFNLLMDYWDSLPEDQKWIVDEELKKIGV